MKLFIDTSKADTIAVGIDGVMHTTDARKEKSQKLLPFIEETLKKYNVNIHSIDEVEVHTGPGSFTGLRVGICVANTLGWALNVPVNGRDIAKEGSVSPMYNSPS